MEKGVLNFGGLVAYVRRYRKGLNFNGWVYYVRRHGVGVLVRKRERPFVNKRGLQAPRPASPAAPGDVAQPACSPQLDRLLHAVLDDPRAWLATPSAHLGGKKPGDLIGTDEEQQVIDLLVAADQGMF